MELTELGHLEPSEVCVGVETVWMAKNIIVCMQPTDGGGDGGDKREGDEILAELERKQAELASIVSSYTQGTICLVIDKLYCTL